MFKLYNSVEHYLVSGFDIIHRLDPDTNVDCLTVVNVYESYVVAGVYLSKSDVIEEIKRAYVFFKDNPNGVYPLSLAQQPEIIEEYTVNSQETH